MEQMENLLFLGVPILKHFRVFSSSWGWCLVSIVLVKVSYMMPRALSDELSCTLTGLVIVEFTIFTLTLLQFPFQEPVLM